MSEGTMRIGEVADAASVNVQTLRYYERRGLLREPGRTPAGRRDYPADTVRFVRFIKRAQDLGFTLREIEELLRLRERRGRSRSQVQKLAAAKADGIDEKIRRLQAMRKALEILLDSCRCAGEELRCPILEALDEPHES